MRSPRAVLAGVIVLAFAAGFLTPAFVTAPPEAAAAVKNTKLRYAIKHKLKVRGETNRGYARRKFKHWIDADGDCRDTRAEVLRQESRRRTTGRCTIRKGKWRSYYDGRVWRRASDVDIDHLVPLAEAWGSGAKRWNKGTRKRFANDLKDRRALVAVTDNVNQSKGARDPAQWLPKRKKCKYVKQWVAVKLRWKLKVDRREKRKLLRIARNKCGKSARVRWKPAKIRKRSGGGGGGGGNCAAGYTPCVPPPPPDLDCADVNGPIYVTGSDPHNLDGDGDGVACEAG